MHKLTLIILDNLENALYLDEHFLACDEEGMASSLQDIAQSIARALNTEVNYIDMPYPLDDGWCWNDVADQVFQKAGGTNE